MYVSIRRRRTLRDFATSHLVLDELEKIGGGDSNVSKACNVALSATKDGLSHPGVVKFGSLADPAVSYKQHMEGRLHKWLSNSPYAGRSINYYDVRLTLRMSEKDHPKQFDVPTIPPWLLFSKLFEFGHNQVRDSLFGIHGPNDVDVYWQHLFLDPEVAAIHPVANREDLKARIQTILPMFIHSDGAVMMDDFELDIWSFSSAFTNGISWDTKNLTLLVPTSLIVKSVTHGEIVRYYAWCCEVWMSGINPSIGYYLEHFARTSVMHKRKGKPLANGWRAAYAGSKADNKEKILVNNFSKPFARNCYSLFVCEFCCACKSEKYPWLSYANCSRHSGWRSTMQTTPGYIRNTSARGIPLSPLTEMPGWTLKRNLPDWMHNAYIQGTCSDACAGCMRTMCNMGDLGPDHELGLRRLWRQWRVWNSKHKLNVRMPMFSLKLINQQDSRKECPELSSRVKAYACKMLCFFLVPILRELASTKGGVERQVMATMMWSLCKMIRTWDTSGDFLTDCEAETSTRFGRLFLSCYTRLSDMNYRRNEACFKLRPKLHYCTHIIDFISITFENPNRAMCFHDEDFLGKIKRVASKTHKRAILKRTLQRYVLKIGVRKFKRYRADKARVAELVSKRACMSAKQI